MSAALRGSRENNFVHRDGQMEACRVMARRWRRRSHGARARGRMEARHKGQKRQGTRGTGNDGGMHGARKTGRVKLETAAPQVLFLFVPLLLEVTELQSGVQRHRARPRQLLSWNLCKRLRRHIFLTQQLRQDVSVGVMLKGTIVLFFSRTYGCFFKQHRPVGPLSRRCPRRRGAALTTTYSTTHDHTRPHCTAPHHICLQLAGVRLR